MKASAPVVQRSALPAVIARLAALCELTKPRLSSLVLVTMLVGFYVGSTGFLDLPLLLCALTGTALLAGGAAALNQWAERDLDARMERTRNRPLPTGRLTPDEVLYFGLTTCLAGVATLAWGVNGLTAVLAVATAAIYLLIYTPLKTRTPWSTVVGAVPGAIPPLMGFAAANGRLDVGAWALFGILFIWQLPHFYAIGWMYRDDYARAGCPILPVLDRDGSTTARWILFLAIALTAFSVAPAWLGLTGKIYPIWAVVLGCGFAATGLMLERTRTRARARGVFLASIVYLPALLVALMLDWTGTAT